MATSTALLNLVSHVNILKTIEKELCSCEGSLIYSVPLIVTIAFFTNNRDMQTKYIVPPVISLGNVNVLRLHAYACVTFFDSDYIVIMLELRIVNIIRIICILFLPAWLLRMSKVKLHHYNWSKYSIHVVSKVRLRHYIIYYNLHLKKNY